MLKDGILSWHLPFKMSVSELGWIVKRNKKKSQQIKRTMNFKGAQRSNAEMLQSERKKRREKGEKSSFPNLCFVQLSFNFIWFHFFRCFHFHRNSLYDYDYCCILTFCHFVVPTTTHQSWFYMCAFSIVDVVRTKKWCVQCHGIMRKVESRGANNAPVALYCSHVGREKRITCSDFNTFSRHKISPNIKWFWLVMHCVWWKILA